MITKRFLRAFNAGRAANNSACALFLPRIDESLEFDQMSQM